MRRRNLCLFPILLLTAAAASPASAQLRASMQMHFPGQMQAPQQAASALPQTLTLQQAEKIAIQNHPQIQAASYLSNAAKAQVTEARSDYYPHAYGSVTGVKAENNSRVAAGALNNPIIF